MKHTRYFALILFLLATSLLPLWGVDATYYSSLDGKSGDQLRSALTQLLFNHHIYYDKYDGDDSGTENWDFPFDYDPITGYVWDIYTNGCNMPSNIGSSGTCCCSGLNREHLVCQSTFGGSGNKDKVPEYADRHALFLTDAYTNQRRNDQAFGEVDKTKTISKGSCAKCEEVAPGYLGSPGTYADLYESTEDIYEPADEYKGDIARAVLYMVVRYAERQYNRLPDGARYYNSKTGVGDVVRSELTTESAHEVTTWKNKGSSTAVTIGQMFSTDLSVNYGLSAYGKAILLKWHRQDPVSQKEIDRNAGVETVQGNRNPFIDYPCLVEYLWGNNAGQAFNTGTNAGSFQTGLFVIGSSDGCSCSTDPMISQPSGTIDFGTTNAAIPLSEKVTVRGLFLNDNTANLTLALKGSNASCFSLSTTSISKAEAENGLEITITYAPSAIGTHTATLSITGCGVTAHNVTLTGACDNRPTVTWSANGDVHHLSAVVSGEKPSLPAKPDNCSGAANRVFVGWTSDADYTSADTQPSDLFTKTAPTVTANTTFYAVYANEAISGGLSDYALLTGDVEEGNYVFYYDGVAMKAEVSSSRLAYSAVTPSNNIISDPNDSLIWRLEKSDNDWTFYNAKVGKYAAGTGAANKIQLLEDGTDEKALWTIADGAITNNYNQNKNVNYTLRKNGTYGFACYGASTGGAPVLYKSTLSISYSDYSTHCATDNYVTLTFHKNDGTSTTASQTVQKNTTAALKSNTWTREHYTFMGWSTTAAGAVTYNDGANINTDSNLDLYAVWQEDTKYTVTWHVVGDFTSEQYYADETLTLPAKPDDCSGAANRVFRGWTAEAGYNNQTTAPTYINASTTVTADAHYYAVFADKSSTGGTTTESVTFSDRYSENTNIEKTAVEIGENTSVTFTKGSSNSQYYTTGTAVRWYAGGTCVITSSAEDITKIEFTFGANDGTNAITAGEGTYEDGIWTGKASSVTFTQAGSTGNRRIAGISVTFGTTAVVTYSKYNTLCSACLSASDPSPSFSENEVVLQTPQGTVSNLLDKDGSDGSVTYSSTNTSVATVNATTGEVSVVGAGTTTISAQLAATSCFNAAEADYTLTVHDFQATAATNITSNGFTANWTTAGASTYSLNVTKEVAAIVSQPTTFINKDFTASLDGWTINNVSGYESTWTHSSSYGAYANTYIKGSDNTYTRYAAESWLISPSIDLTNATSATLTMSNVFRYDDNVFLMISSDGGNNWTQLSPSNWTVASSWTFVTSEADLTDYLGQTVLVGFKYVGTTEASAAWEIKTFAVTGTADVATVLHEPLAGYPKEVTGTSAVITGLTPQTNYHYTVTPAGGEASDEIDVTTAEEASCFVTVTAISPDDTQGTANVE